MPGEVTPDYSSELQRLDQISADLRAISARYEALLLDGRQREVVRASRVMLDAVNAQYGHLFDCDETIPPTDERDTYPWWDAMHWSPTPLEPTDL